MSKGSEVDKGAASVTTTPNQLCLRFGNQTSRLDISRP